MKTKSLFFSILLITVILTTSVTTAQEKEGYSMAEITYMLPKIGMEKEFVDGVNAHNEKYHKEGPFKASMDYILTGKEAGWYVWIMGPCTFTDLDSRPKDDAHTKDWDDRIAPSVAKYGKTEFWRFNDKLSYVEHMPEKTSIENIWFLGIEDGQGYKFREFLEKVKKAFEKKGEGNFRVYYNQFSEGNGRDVAIVWSMSNWAEMDDDDGGIKDSFEEIYGKGSWENALKDWDASTSSMKSQVWRIGVN